MYNIYQEPNKDKNKIKMTKLLFGVKMAKFTFNTKIP